jgi:pimeloyl-ACP methyl ester carboxylesterase
MRDIPVLHWSEVGERDGPVVVYFHGTANGKQEIPFPEAAERLGIRLLMADRPGYGISTAAPDASLLDVARTILRDLDGLGAEQFSVLGFSGGGPYALACAAAAPARVHAVGLLSSWAPMTPPHRGLPLGVRVAMRAASALPRPALRLMFLLGMQTTVGMVDDVRRVSHPWTFEITTVSSTVRVLAWHAEGDPQVPAAPWHDIAGVGLTITSGDAHETPPDVWESALRSVC